MINFAHKKADFTMKIADIDLGTHPVFLAPMEDVTDPAFRLMCKQFGADMVYTEFVSADALIRSVRKTEQKLNISDEERPVAIQIYGKDTDTMAEAARIVEEARPNILDINFGCPVKRVAGKGAGAGMLQNVPLMLDITRAVVNAVKIPVTVKTRLGWDADHKIIVTLAEQLQDCGIAALTIHGRTRAQMYTGEADWTLIGEVKKNPRMRIPIIGNGDVTTPRRAKECFDLYGVDAVMIGRASFGRPWLFKEVKHYRRRVAPAQFRVATERVAPRGGRQHPAAGRTSGHSARASPSGGQPFVQRYSQFPRDADSHAARRNKGRAVSPLRGHHSDAAVVPAT